MKRFLSLALVMMATVVMIFSAGCSNQLPSSTTAAVAPSSPAAPSTVGYTRTEYWYATYPSGGYTYYPWGIGILPNGNLAVMDEDYAEGSISTPSDKPNNGGAVQALSNFGSGKLSDPYGMTVDNQGNIWVADSNNYRIVKMDQHGNIATSFGHYGTSGTNGAFEWPDGVAFDGKGNIYVLDYYTGVQVFDANFNYITSWGNGSFSDPYGGIASDGTNIFIADTYHYQVKKYTAKGQFIKAVGTYGTGMSQFEFVTGVATDAQGNVYTGDYYSGLQKFDNNLNFKTYVGTPSEFYDGAYTMTVDNSTGAVYATDYYYYIYKFVPNK